MGFINGNELYQKYFQTKFNCIIWKFKNIKIMLSRNNKNMSSNF